MAFSRVSSCQVPCPGVMTNESAAEPRHAGLKGGQGAQRRIEEHQPEDLAGERVRLRLVLQRLRERQQIEDLLALEIGEVEKALHAGIFDRASRS